MEQVQFESPETHAPSPTPTSKNLTGKEIATATVAVTMASFFVGAAGYLGRRLAQKIWPVPSTKVSVRIFNESPDSPTIDPPVSAS